MAPMRDACSKLIIENAGTVFRPPEQGPVTMGDDGDDDDDDFGTGPAVILIVTTVTIVTLNG